MQVKLSEVIELKADVLVIGGGGAGLRAAISAREGGADVLLVSKSRPGYGNNTAIAGGAFATAGGWREPRDNPEVYKQDALRSGRFINNERLVEVMAEGSVRQVGDLERYGVNLARTEGALRISHVPGHTYPRHVGCVEHIGAGLSVPMRRHALGLGVRFLEGVAVTRLAKKGNTVTGGLGVDGRTRFYNLSARATVLATGGLGQLYRQTNNVVEATGDGYALAYELGLPLQDMEFVQFYPTCVKRRNVMVLTVYEHLVFMGGAAIRNTLGQDILELYGLRDPIAMTRDHLAQAMMREVKAGRSYQGFLNLDLASMPESKRDRYRTAVPKGTSPDVASLMVSPAVHYAMGGVQIDERTRTGLHGLYAAGEVCGGIQGANRLAGSALTEVFVFGDIAGREACEHAKTSKSPQTNVPVVKEEKGRLEGWLGRTGKESVAAILASLKKTMWENVGVTRDEQGLGQALADIRSLRQDLASAGVESPREWLRALRLEKMLTVAEMVARSAQARKESRGAHYRTDYPEEKDPAWRCNVVVRKKGSNMGLSIRPVKGFFLR